MATIHKVGDGNLYHVHFLQPTDPGFGQGGGHPDQGLPGHGHPDQGLPGSGGHPGNRPPGSGHPAFPDHTLPGGPPPHVPPGTTLILVRDPAGVWHYAAIQPGQPVPPPLPDQGLPTPPTRPGQPLPPTPAPKPV
jgi:hypothetical protein